MRSAPLRTSQWIATRWLGVGLAAVLAVVTLGLAVTNRLALYINPDSAWFAVGMAILALVGAVASFAVPLGAEAEHGHDHPHPHLHPPLRDGRSLGGRGPSSVPHGPATADHSHDDASGLPARSPFAIAATVTGGVLASGIAVATLVLPPASLSVELAMARDVGAAPLFAGQDAVTLAASGDTSTFGIGDWATVFATSTSPDRFDGEPVTLTGFVTPDPDDPSSMRLTRLVITHCVIDAQPAAVPVVSPGWDGDLAVGDWVEIDGTVTTSEGGELVVTPTSMTPIPEPSDPYEY